MAGLAAAALILSTAALSVAFLLWRRVRRLERQPARKSPSPADLERGIFDSVELSLEAMLEEMELKEREILNRLERRERELWEALGHAGLAGGDGAPKEDRALSTPPSSTTSPAGDRQTGENIAPKPPADNQAHATIVSTAPTSGSKEPTETNLSDEPAKSAPAVTKSPATASEGSPGRPLSMRDEKSAAVLRLAAEGHDVVTIAKLLGLGKGEVALILKLGQ